MVVNPSKPDDTQPSGQVLSFRMRPRAPGPPGGAPGLGADGDDLFDDDLSRYEEADAHIDYRQRMLMNVIAVVIVTALVGLGVWIADTIADIEKAQDCVMQGRQNCAPIEFPPHNR